MSADLCPTTGRMHRTDWTECVHCRYLCHCGEPILIHEDGFTRDLCEHCDSVRCDAFPGACEGKFHDEAWGLHALKAGISSIEYALERLQHGYAYEDRGSAEFHLECGLSFLRGLMPQDTPTKRPRIWFYHPEWYWHGWSTLLPVHRGGDEWNRWTLMFGWTITGRVVVALWPFKDN